MSKIIRSVGNLKYNPFCENDRLEYEIPKIIIDPNSSQGLNLSDHVILGVKGGYVERLLIHELIHWFLKIRHTYPSDFFAATYPDDELSTFIEKRLFG